GSHLQQERRAVSGLLAGGRGLCIWLRRGCGGCNVSTPHLLVFDHFLLLGVFTDELVLDIFFFSSRRRHTRCYRDWSSDVCSSDLLSVRPAVLPLPVMLPGTSAFGGSYLAG